MKPVLRLAWMVLLTPAPAVAHAEDLIEVIGHVMAADGKTPSAGAVVTAFDDKDQVVGQAATDSDGVYKMLIPRSALHLDPPKSPHHGNGLGNLIGSVVKTAGSVLTTSSGPGFGSPGLGGFGFGTPSPLGGFGLAALNGANPFKVFTNLTIANMATRLIGAGVPPAQAQATAAGLKAGTLTKDQAVQQIQVSGVPKDKAEAALADLARDGTAAAAAPTRQTPGAVQIKVTQDGQGAMSGPAMAYQMTQQAGPGGKGERLVANLDPVVLQSAGAATSSCVMHQNMLFIAAQLEPAIAHYGDTAHVKVLVGVPPDSGTLVVLARLKSGALVALQPGDPGVYEADLSIDRKLPRGEQLVPVIAYLSGAAGRDIKVEEQLAKAGVWETEKPYLFNPLLHASKNRADLKLTVLEPNPR